MKKIIFAAIAVLGISVSSSAQADKSKIDAYFAALEKNDKFMGNVLLLKDGKPV